MATSSPFWIFIGLLRPFYPSFCFFCFSFYRLSKLHLYTLSLYLLLSSSPPIPPNKPIHHWLNHLPLMTHPYPSLATTSSPSIHPPSPTNPTNISSFSSQLLCNGQMFRNCNNGVLLLHICNLSIEWRILSPWTFTSTTTSLSRSRVAFCLCSIHNLYRLLSLFHPSTSKNNFLSTLANSKSLNFLI